MSEKKLFTQDELNAAIAAAIANITPETLIEAQIKRTNEEQKRRKIESATNSINAFRQKCCEFSKNPDVETLSSELKEAIAAYAFAQLKEAESLLEHENYEDIRLTDSVFRMAKSIQTEEKAARYESNYRTVNRLVEEIKTITSRTKKYVSEANMIEEAANAFLKSRFATRP